MSAYLYTCLLLEVLALHYIQFIQAIAAAPLQVHYYAEALPTAWVLCRSFMPKHHKHLRVMDLLKVLTWWLEYYYSIVSLFNILSTNRNSYNRCKIISNVNIPKR